MQPVPSPLSTPPPPPLRSHWQRVALPIQFLVLILGIMLLGSVVRCEHKRLAPNTGNPQPSSQSQDDAAAKQAVGPKPSG